MTEFVQIQNIRDINAPAHTITTRYEVRHDNILKTQDDGQTYQYLSDDEARNLYKAVGLYEQQVMLTYQNMAHAA